ncbi:hypothetical protein K1719_008576 [Acacia pycnantha]|nr:hypothetical protein K1719_008576 [Acacia pycnantha]
MKVHPTVKKTQRKMEKKQQKSALLSAKPAEFSLTLHSDVHDKALIRKFPLAVKGYDYGDKNKEVLGAGGVVVLFYDFVLADGCASPRSILKSCWSSD